MTQMRMIATTLDEAAATATPVRQPDTGYELSTAYAIQDELIGLRLARGERMTGIKLGFTSQAKREQMGVDDVIFGRLTDGMHIPDGGEINISSYIHPRAEPEVAFLLGQHITDPTSTDLQVAVAGVAAGIEVIDSRYHDFRFSLADVVADNTSAAGFAIGPWQAMTPDLANRGVVFSLDGHPARVGSTAAILGEDRKSVV